MSTASKFGDAHGNLGEPVTVEHAEDASSAATPTSRPSRRFSRKRTQAELITSARRSPAENRRERETKYLILQGMRIPFVLLSIAAVLWWENWWLALLFFAISIPLPWISVVIANDSNEVRDKRTQNVYKPAAARQYSAASLEAQQQRQLPSAGGAGEHGAGTIDHED